MSNRIGSFLLFSVCLVGLGSGYDDSRRSSEKESKRSKGHGSHWSYQGDSGPAHWGDLKAEYATCGTGKEQSPIDIEKFSQYVDGDRLPPIDFNYNSVLLEIVNNGHTVQVTGGDAGGIRVGDDEYKLLQFHFHSPSEHQIGGKAWDMEAHLVHQNKEGRLAVVGVMIEAGEESPFFAQFWKHLPKKKGSPQDHKTLVEPEKLLPTDRGYFTYPGSLTTPPCSEGVRWLVLSDPVQASPEQILKFMSLHPGSARPVQPINHREVLKK